MKVTFLSEEEVKKLSKSELSLYNEKVKVYIDLKNMIDSIEEKNRQIAKNCPLLGISIEKIAKITDLSIEEVKNISDSLKEI